MAYLWDFPSHEKKSRSHGILRKVWDKNPMGLETPGISGKSQKKNRTNLGFFGITGFNSKKIPISKIRKSRDFSFRLFPLAQDVFEGDSNNIILRFNNVKLFWKTGFYTVLQSVDSKDFFLKHFFHFYIFTIVEKYYSIRRKHLKHFGVNFSTTSVISPEVNST